MIVSNEMLILVVDDEKPIRRYLRTVLAAQGYSVSEAANGQDALTMTGKEHPDLIVLDLGLPDIDGLEVIRRLREWTLTPIIILSVREQESDKVAALDSGADDYLTKPFGSEELFARLRVASRRLMKTDGEPVYQVDDLIVNLLERKVSLQGEDVPLTPTEYDLLRILVQNSGKVLTHHYLLDQVWGKSYEEETHLLRVNMSNLRRKIEPDPSRPHYILTEPGVGYRLRAESVKRQG
jgi:two-component system KDP operon response regulator KdpE